MSDQLSCVVWYDKILSFPFKSVASAVASAAPSLLFLKDGFLKDEWEQRKQEKKKVSRTRK